MNITIITPSLPYPLNSGGAQGQYNFIDKLRSKHHIAIIFPMNGKNRPEALQHLQTIWPEVTFHPYSYLRQLTHGPFLKDKITRAVKLKVCPQSERFAVERALKPYGFYFTCDFVSFVNDIIRQHKTDIIQVDFYQYLHIIHHLPADIRKIYVQHEIRYIRNQRLLAPIHLTPEEKAWYEEIRQMEIDDLNAFNQIIAVTANDKDNMVRDGVKTPISVSPSAVNTPVLPFEGWNGKVTFLGGYSHIPNQEGMEWFLQKVLPMVHLDSIQAIEVVGSGWPQHYNTIHPKVRFLGFVEDLTQAVHRSLLIVPILTGSGMRMKILDAAAMSVPFITTTVGVEGLNFKHDTSCLVADTPEDFAQAINVLVADTARMQALAVNAQQIFNEQYSVEALAKVRNNIYEQR